MSGDPDPLLGRVIDGFRLERFLARGGMGAVYEARDARGQRAVVKLLADELSMDPEARARFVREGEVMRRLPPHPNLVGVLAVEPQTPALVLEFAAGSPLDRVLAERGPFPAELALRVGRDVARALGQVHALGLIHRDVKPENVILEPSGRARLIDFGVSKDTFRTVLTASAQVLGTTLFMAPERWDDGAEADARADLFSLGAMLYQLLSGQPPFAGEDLVELIDAILEDEREPLDELRPDLPGPVVRVVERLLATEPSHRHASAHELAEELEGLLAGEGDDPPRFEHPAHGRLVLTEHARVVLGSDPSLPWVLPGAPVRALQIRRTERGWEATDVCGGAVRVAGQPLSGPRVLRDGDAVRLGEVELAFRDPRGGASEGGLAGPLPRVERPEAEVAALAAAGDPRALAWLLEWTDLGPEEIAAAVAATPAARAQLEALGRAVRREALARAEQLLPPGGSFAERLSAWLAARAQLPPQHVPSLPPGALALEVHEPGRPARLWEPDPGAARLLIGRDQRCDLVVADPRVSRLQLVLLRLSERWAARNESHHGTWIDGAPRAAALLGSSSELRLGESCLRVRWTPAPGPPRLLRALRRQAN